MSQENVEIVRKAIEAPNRRDVAMARALWHTEAEVDWSRSLGPLKGVYRGREEVETFQDEFWSMFEKVELEAHGFMQAGSDVVVPNTAHLRGRDGMEVIARSAFVYTVEGGRITRLQMFQGSDEALEAAGLWE
jgi:ketosteroid isomerase-like protein